jgi:hypothetical protein
MKICIRCKLNKDDTLFHKKNQNVKTCCSITSKECYQQG